MGGAFVLQRRAGQPRSENTTSCLSGPAVLGPPQCLSLAVAASPNSKKKARGPERQQDTHATLQCRHTATDSEINLRWSLAVVLPRPARGAGTLIPSAQRLVWAAKHALGKAALGAFQAPPGSQASSCLRKGTPLASRVAQGVSGPPLSCAS